MSFLCIFTGDCDTLMCDHMCINMGYQGARCICSQDYSLQEDGVSCNSKICWSICLSNEMQHVRLNVAICRLHVRLNVAICRLRHVRLNVAIYRYQQLIRLNVAICRLHVRLNVAICRLHVRLNVAICRY